MVGYGIIYIDGMDGNWWVHVGTLQVLQAIPKEYNINQYQCQACLDGNPWVGTCLYSLLMSGSGLHAANYQQSLEEWEIVRSSFPSGRTIRTQGNEKRNTTRSHEMLQATHTYGVSEFGDLFQVHELICLDHFLQFLHSILQFIRPQEFHHLARDHLGHPQDIFILDIEGKK